MKNKTSIFLLMVLMTSAANVLADGMMVSAPTYYINENSQQALVHYDAETQTEIISILPGFQSDTNEFAWILPMPALPQVEAGDPTLFRQLREFTQPKYHYRDNDWDGCDKYRDIYSTDNGSDGVQVIVSQLVGYYQTMTLAADQADALLDSLTTWGFLHSENIEQATDLITGYVEQDWYFVTVKIDSVTFAETYPDYNYWGYYGGHLNPLTFTFDSESIIYPMRISALSAAESTRLDLYVVADHRMDFPGASTRYANHFNEAEINQINGSYFSTVKNLLEPGDFLTHLRRDYRPQDMTEDITIVRASNDDEYRLIYYSGFPWMTLVFLGPAVLWGLYRKFSGTRPLEN